MTWRLRSWLLGVFFCTRRKERFRFSSLPRFLSFGLGGLEDFYLRPFFVFYLRLSSSGQFCLHPFIGSSNFIFSLGKSLGCRSSTLDHHVELLWQVGLITYWCRPPKAPIVVLVHLFPLLWLQVRSFGVWSKAASDVAASELKLAEAEKRRGFECMLCSVNTAVIIAIVSMSFLKSSFYHILPPPPPPPSPSSYSTSCHSHDYVFILDHHLWHRYL